MSGCPNCDGRPGGCMDCSPVLIDVRGPILNPDAHILLMKLEDAFRYLKIEQAAHDATKARLGKAEQFIQDMVLMLEKAPVDLVEWEDHRADEDDRKKRFERYSK